MKSNESQKIKASDLLAVLVRQEYRCALSGRTLTPQSAQIDHIVPVAKGGGHELSNLWIVEDAINFAKGTMTVEDFLSVCRDVTRFNQSSSQSETGGRNGEETRAKA